MMRRIPSILMSLISLTACLSSQSLSSTRTISGGSNYTVELWSDTNCAEPGKTVTVRATVVNHGSRKQLVELQKRPVLDIIITDRNGEHRWSDEKALTPDLTRLELDAGQSKMIEMQWLVQRDSSPLVASAQFIYDAESVGGPLTPSFNVPVAPSCYGLGP